MQVSHTTNTANSTAANSAAAASTSGTSSSAAGTPLDPTGQLTNESTFLQLLVAQIKNQDPLNPTDSIQFVGQLVQFSQLEQLLSINQNLGTLVTDAGSTAGTGSTASGSTTTGGTNSTNGSSNT